jgi:hypothetical protein
MRALDFSTLTQPLTPGDLQMVAGTAKRGNKVIVWVTAVVVALIGLFVILAMLASGSFSPILSVLPQLLIFGTVVSVLVIAAAAASRHRKQYLARVGRFAAANGMTFRFDTVPTGLNGMIFDEGHSRKINEVISSPDGYEIGNLEYVTGSGKNRQTHTFGFIRVALSRHLPNMVLDARKNNFWKFTNLPDSFDRSQRLSLEGDFDTYFDLYVPKQFERDALYVFTPDVMQALIDNGSDYDMEIVDDQLYMYRTTKHDLASEASLRGALVMMDAISAEVTHQTMRYSDERVAGNQSGQVVSTTGQRLKRGLNPIIIVVVIVVILQLFLQFVIR